MARGRGFTYTSKKKKEDEMETSVKKANTQQPTLAPTLNDYVSVAETGGLPKEQPKSPYDTYMEEAKRFYNQGVESNNQIAESQSASAGAEYRELNRNINEINKANGKANTGYAGDTSIDAYNAYRNAVSSTYSNAQNANNDLYSYYLGEMSRLQSEKTLYEDQKETNVLSEVSNFLSQEDAFNPDGTISNDTALKTWNYIKRIYGDNIPNSTMAYLESQDGFTKWLDAYNKGSKEYTEKYNKPFLFMDSEEGYRGDDNTPGKVNVQGFGTTDRKRNDIDLTIGKTEYDLRMGDPATDEEAQELNALFEKQGKTPSAKQTAVYNGALYIVDHSGRWRKMIGDESTIQDAIKAYMKSVYNK